MATGPSLPPIRITLDASDVHREALAVARSIRLIDSVARGSTTSLADMTRELTQSARAADRLGRELDSTTRSARGLETAANGLNGVLGALASRMTGMRGLGGAIFAGFSLVGIAAITSALGSLDGGLTKLMDTSAMIDARLRLATRSFGTFAQASKDVRDVAAGTRSELLSTTTLYANIAAKAGTLGINQAQVATATRAVGQSMKISGADAAAASGAIRQLSQSLASGVFRGEEFNSVYEASPRLMRLLADSMGIAEGALRNLAGEGKLTAAELIKALTDPKLLAELQAEFNQIPTTFGDIKTHVGNLAVDMAGAFAKGLGVEQSLGKFAKSFEGYAERFAPTFERIGKATKQAFEGLAPIFSAVFGTLGAVLGPLINNMDTVIALAKNLAGAFIAVKAVGLVGSLATHISSLIALQRALGATSTASALFGLSLKAVQGAIRGVTLAIAANPIGFLAVGLTTAITLLYQFRDAIELGGGRIGTLGDLIQAFVNRIGPQWAQMSASMSAAAKSVEDAWNVSLSAISDVFGKLDISLGGAITLMASYADFTVNNWMQVFGNLKAIFQLFGSVFLDPIIIAVNAAKLVFQGFVNSSIWMINKLIDGVNRLGASINKIDYKMDLEMTGLVGGNPFENFANANKRDFNAFAEGSRKLFEEARSIALQNRTGGIYASAARMARDAIENPAPKVSKPLAPPAPAKPGKSGDGGKSAAETEAEKAKKALEEQAKKVKEFWDGMENARKAASMLPEEAERFNKELELSKVLGGEIASGDKERLATLMKETELAKTLTSMKVTAKQLENENLLLGQQKLGLSEDQQRIEDELYKVKLAALNAGVDITNAEFQKQLDVLRVLNEQNAALKQKAVLARTAQEDAERLNPSLKAARLAGDVKTRQDAYLAEVQKRDASLLLNKEKIAKDLADIQTQVIGETAEHFKISFGEAIDALSQDLGGKFGKALKALDNLDILLKGNGKKGGLGSVANQLFGSKFTESMKTALEPIAAGANIGIQSDQLVKALGVKGSKTGGAIGGSIGMMVGGPLGAAIGGALGSFTGGLLKQTPKGSATLGFNADGDLSVSSLTGNNKGAKAAANDAAGQVISGLYDIANRLGADLGGNGLSVSIGQRHGDYRVDTSGQGITKKKKGAIDFDGDAEAAIAFAIKDAIKDGVLTGLSSFSDRLLKSSNNLDSAISLAESYEKVLDDLAAIDDPFGAAAKNITTNLDRMIEQMQKAGATQAEIANVERYRTIKLEEYAKEQKASVTDLIKSLTTGDNSGLSTLDRLKAAQAEFASYQSLIAAGKSFDQDAFAELGSDIMGYARELYGNTSQAQEIRDALTKVSQDALVAIDTKIEADKTAEAVNNQTTVVAANQETQTEVLNEMANEIRMLRAQIGGSGASSKGSTYVNGRKVA